MGLKAKKIGSMQKLKKSLKNTGGGGNFLTRVSKDGLTVRFLTEPDQWIEYYEHFDDERKFYPCSDDCPGCKDNNRPSKRYLVRALDRNDNKVVGLVLPGTLAKTLTDVMYEKFSTLLDRDYELIRTGEGMNDTRYTTVPESPKSVRLSRYSADKPVDSGDLMEMLEESYNRAFDMDDEDADTDSDEDLLEDVDDEDDEDEPVTRRGSRSRQKSAPARKATPARKSVPARKAVPAKTASKSTKRTVTKTVSKPASTKKRPLRRN